MTPPSCSIEVTVWGGLSLWVRLVHLVLSVSPSIWGFLVWSPHLKADHREWLCVVVCFLVVWGCLTLLFDPSLLYSTSPLTYGSKYCSACVFVWVCMPTYKQIMRVGEIVGFIWVDAEGQEEAVCWYWIRPHGYRLCWWLLYWLIKELACFYATWNTA